jgi:hypothetical protein
MSITGYLTDLSLTEIFQFIEQGQKTGLLTVRNLPESSITLSVHYFWAKQGKIVAAAHQLNEQGLIWLIHQYPWVSYRAIAKLAQFCPFNKPLGLYLKSQGALQIEQLEHLFQIQVVQELCVLFQLKDAQFQFDQDIQVPRREMTGLSIPATALAEVLQKLVMLKKFYDLRRFHSERSGVSSQSENFCQQLTWILDVAFFHSLNFSLFDTQSSLSKLYQAFDWFDRPYDLPISRQDRELSCR